MLGSWCVYSGDSGLMLLVSFVAELVWCVVVCLLFALVGFEVVFARFADVVVFVVLVGVVSGCLVGCCMLLTVVGFGFGLWCLCGFWLLWVIGLVCYSAVLFGGFDCLRLELFVDWRLRILACWQIWVWSCSGFEFGWFCYLILLFGVRVVILVGLVFM